MPDNNLPDDDLMAVADAVAEPAPPVVPGPASLAEAFAALMEKSQGLRSIGAEQRLLAYAAADTGDDDGALLLLGRAEVCDARADQIERAARYLVRVTSEQTRVRVQGAA